MNHDHSLEKVYKEAFPTVAKMLSNLGADLATAKDIFHDAIIIYLERVRDHRIPDAVGPTQYIAGIARICWFKHCRQRTPVSDAMEVGNIIAHQEHSDPERKWRLLREYVQTAGTSCMRLLQAFYYEGLSMPKIAEKFNYRSTHSATVQKYKCLEKLREKIKNTEIYEEAIA